ncbi:Peroxyureidoacrylate/ureidoacrylate amidohydrolase RutB [Pseudomonas cannabina]|uniref:Peroxyureidoacrylate/ureidoacrylate amidohydrolase RutB n=1 Tax=Pseudomonas cannabina TaxID=86840 RepID=A0A0P9L1R5_PSECA|nr:Peroxyureidoacrylate/ureidoacrylate amidohydrolase RutB [Pseudomonas cannabina]RMN16371.1 Peroxyureidoacrylate/ureidoacrylate amidohydrolase RutB [Pseudomonas cannabina]
MNAPTTVAGVDLPLDQQPARELPARPEALRMKLGETALVVVDMQNAYASPGGYLDLAGFDVSSTGPVIANIKKACAAARAAGIPVIFSRTAGTRPMSKPVAPARLTGTSPTP